MSETYEKPVIVKMQTGMSNKFGSSPLYGWKIRENIDGVGIEELVDTFGSPLFVFSETALREKYREVYGAFSSRYPNVTFGWSYKTNYLPAICSVFHQEGAIAEVVSEMEYDKARRLGIPGKDIIFNGPHKSMQALETAVTEGAMIHIDHFDELYDLEKLADKLGEPIKVGLRLNLDTGSHTQWSRFGFNLESGQAFDAVKRMADAGKLCLRGLHCHIGTYILDPQAYAVQVEKMVAFAYEVEEHFGFNIEYLDIGGGLPSKSKLKGTYHPPDLVVPSADEYAEAITSALYTHLRPGEFPRLILESGRAMVDEAGFLISSIIASKRLPDGRKAYVADGGINLLYTSFWYTYNLEFSRPVHGMVEPTTIYGPMCMNIDVVREGVLLPPLDRGTRLILSPVGAYNVTQWMQFIEYRPNVVLVGSDGQVDIIREAEDYTDIARRERVPQRLAEPKAVAAESVQAAHMESPELLKAAS
ncbi:MAG: diaminopimelate decarboxylase [bacterium]|nr:diaminopimelate decarboxylase [bacterium]